MRYKICIIGLGYVGLPLAHAFSSKGDGVILAIAHNEFKKLDLNVDGNTVVYDITSIIDDADRRL